MELHFKTPTKEQMKEIKNLIINYRLDGEQLEENSFICASNTHNEVLGFVRLRIHQTCNELCSLGVVEKYRNKGIGKALSGEVIKRFPNNLFLVCIIPDFFSTLGFKEIAESIPTEIQGKMKRCIHNLPVDGEKYTVMKYIQ